MSSTITSLMATYRQVIIYGGIPILLAGLAGGLLNAIVFLSLKTFRQSPCAFYLTVLSMVNIGQLVAGLFTRIMISGFAVDWTQSSLFYCKFRTFFFQTTSLISLACICLATIDQYLATCSRPRWQQWSNIKLARRLLVGLVVLIVAEQTPCVIFYNHRRSSSTNETSCAITNDLFDRFNTYFTFLVLGNIIPYLTTFSFSIMAYRNVQQLSYRTVPLVRRDLDKQLTVMVLVQVVYNLLAILPNFVVFLVSAYGNIPDPVMRAQINLAYAITLCLYYSYFASPFYIYMGVSDRFRRQFNYVLFGTRLTRCRQRRRVAPEQTDN